MSLIDSLSWNGPILVAPGLHGSGTEHWQSRWQRRRADFIRVEQQDWATPDLDRWARQIVETALPLQQPALLIAHSFGCLATIRAAAFQSELIAGALLVAPANPARFGLQGVLSQTPLPFPSTLVASHNDPWLSYEDAQVWAERWGSRFESVGLSGHINAESGLGDWDIGQQWLEQLCRRLKPPRCLPDVAVAMGRPVSSWA